MANKAKKRVGLKIFLGVLIFLLLLVLVPSVTFVIVWNNEIKTVLSIEKLADANESNDGGPVYSMEVSGDYYFEEFLAQGGASSEEELVRFLVNKISRNIVPEDMEIPGVGCASFTCNDGNGNYYFARNYDFSTTTAMIVKTAPTDGRYASISSVDLQFVGIEGVDIESLTQKLVCLVAPYAPLDGINSAGVACGIYMSYQGIEDSEVGTDQRTEKPDLTSTTMLRLILDYAGSVEEAVELVKKYDLHDSADTPFHYMVADSTGKSAILEWVYATDRRDVYGEKRELKVYYNDADSDVGEKEKNDNFQYVTNFIVAPDYYESDYDKRGVGRYEEIQSMINPDGTNVNGVVTKEFAMEVLATVGRRTWDSVHGTSEDENDVTVWSALYDLTNKSVTWVNNEEFDDPASVFTFDFSYLKVE